MRKFKLHNGKSGAALTVRVTPRARKTEFADVREDGTLRIRITEPPVEDKANSALIKFLARVLGVKKNCIEIVAGEKGLDKIISIEGMTALDVERRINDYMAKQQSK